MTTLTPTIGQWRLMVEDLTPDPSHPFRVRVLVHYVIGNREALYFCPLGKNREDGLNKLRQLVAGSRAISPATRAEILAAVDGANNVSVPA